jgi:hypothetical protein
MPEEWKDAINYEDYYEVSDLGNVRRKGRLSNLAKVIDKDGYVCHCFSVKHKRTNVMAHKLVIEAFFGPCPNGEVTRHIDGVTINNVPSNLIYGTPKDNSMDMVNHGTQTKGIDSHLAKLTETNVLSIRASSESQATLARLYKVTPATVWSIINRKTWKHI